MRIVTQILLAALALALVEPAYSEDWRGRELGGTNGTKFDARCRPNEYLVGLRSRLGEVIDSIAPVCTKYPGEREFLSEIATRPDHGGNGGSPMSAVCPMNFPVVIGMVVSGSFIEGDDTYVDAIQLTCGSESKNQPLDIQYPTLTLSKYAFRRGLAGGNPLKDGPREETNCPAGMIAAGVFGRSGIYVDALGLVCTPVFMNSLSACTLYAKGAMKQVAQAQSRNCNFSEQPRWSLSSADHREWCRRGGPTAQMLLAEHDVRRQALNAACGLVTAPGPNASDMMADPPARVEKESDPSAYDKFEAPSGVIVGKPVPGTSAGTYADPAAASKFSDQMTKTPAAGVPGSGFTATWSTVTAAKTRYAMKLTQTDHAVSGTYMSPNGANTGTISGTVVAGTLIYRWTEGANTGSGKFKLSADGSRFTGWWNYSADNPDAVEGSWNGTRNEETFRAPR